MAIRTAKKKRPSGRREAGWKGKTPTDRRKSERAEQRSSASAGFATVSVKLRTAEKEAFKQVCDELGLTPNKAMRIMARKAAGFLELDPQSIANLETLTQQIIGVSRNINQIAKAANITHSPDYLAFMEDRAELSVELRQLQRILQGLTNVAKRRSDGLADLKEATS